MRPADVSLARRSLPHRLLCGDGQSCARALKCAAAAATLLASAMFVGCPGSTNADDPCLGVTCGPGRTCVDGQSKDDGSTVCNGTVCAPGASCINNKCVESCGAAAACQGGLECCAGGCTDLASDLAACGGCDKACGKNADKCAGGTCVCGTGAACASGDVCCSGACHSGQCPAGTCGDATCDGSETCQTCPSDCGQCGPACGDGACKGAENCQSCETDCGKCPPGCGDGKCDAGEACTNCPLDCGQCAPKCGDGSCNGSEDCTSCPGDCGPCPPSCGNKACDNGEDCKSCPADCGACLPTCGDAQCNGSETCVTCASDCGQCQCTPNKTETSSAGCAPCAEQQRTCQADGTWGSYGACQPKCTSAQVCVNGQCAECTPGTQDTQACSCGEKTRTCDANGAWGTYGSCVSNCGAGLTCLSGNRCGKTYTSYGSAGGPECGYTYSGGVQQYVYCEPLDYCESSSQKRCRKYDPRQVGDDYHAWSSAGGPECGYRYAGTVKLQFYCQCGDLCASSSQRRCTISGTECNVAVYNACASAGGAECGYTYVGTVKKDFYCKPGDQCTSSSQKRCTVKTTCGAGSTYSAYRSAGGANCGYTYVGTVKVDYYCQPGDTCQSSSQKLCRR